MERSMTNEEWQEEMLMMDLEKRGLIHPLSREEALKNLEKRLAEMEAKRKE